MPDLGMLACDSTQSSASSDISRSNEVECWHSFSLLSVLLYKYLRSKNNEWTSTRFATQNNGHCESMCEK